MKTLEQKFEELKVQFLMLRKAENDYQMGLTTLVERMNQSHDATQRFKLIMLDIEENHHINSNAISYILDKYENPNFEWSQLEID